MFEDNKWPTQNTYTINTKIKYQSDPQCDTLKLLFLNKQHLYQALNMKIKLCSWICTCSHQIYWCALSYLESLNLWRHKIIYFLSRSRMILQGAYFVLMNMTEEQRSKESTGTMAWWIIFPYLLYEHFLLFPVFIVQAPDGTSRQPHMNRYTRVIYEHITDKSENRNPSIHRQICKSWRRWTSQNLRAPTLTFPKSSLAWALLTLWRCPKFDLGKPHVLGTHVYHTLTHTINVIVHRHLTNFV